MVAKPVTRVGKSDDAGATIPKLSNATLPLHDGAAITGHAQPWRDAVSAWGFRYSYHVSTISYAPTTN
jgi:hypothetical protein